MAGQDVVDDLGPGGRALWTELAPGGQVAPGERSLIIEACRIVDRLDKLDTMLAGDASAWITLTSRPGCDDVVEVVIDKQLGEARQQATTLKALLGELRQMRGGKLGRAASGGSVADELAAARKKRLAAAKSS